MQAPSLFQSHPQRQRLFAGLGLLLIVLIGLGLRIGYGTQKKGYHIDETYSYLLAANRQADFEALWHAKNRADQVLSGRDLIAMMYLEPAQHGRYGDLVKGTARDVHPPLYYLLLHEAMALGGQAERKWVGLGLNCLLYLIEAWLLFLLGRRLWPERPWLALLTVLIWSIGLAAISSSLMARMYELLTLWCLLALWSGFGLLAPAPRRREFAWLALACLGGMLSHYFFLLLLAPLTVLLAWRLRRRPAWLAGLLASVTLPLMLAAALFPAGLRHVFGSYRSRGMQHLAFSALEGRASGVLDNLAGYAVKLQTYCLPAACLALLGIVGFGLGYHVWRRQPLSGAWTWRQSGLLLILLVYTGITCALTPFISIRYIGPALPLMAICLVALPASLPEARWRIAALTLLTLSLALTALLGKPDLLYRNFPPRLNPTRPLYVTTAKHSGGLNLIQLVHADQALHFAPVLPQAQRGQPWPTRDFYAFIYTQTPWPDFGARRQTRKPVKLGRVTLLEF